jgi:hypothetical protein
VTVHAVGLCTQWGSLLCSRLVRGASFSEMFVVLLSTLKCRTMLTAQVGAYCASSHIALYIRYFRICRFRGPGIAFHQSRVLLTPRSSRNWARSSASVSKQPRAQLVIDVALVFWTPRITMHRWLDSTVTMTPCGLMGFAMAWATSLVRRS